MMKGCKDREVANNERGNKELEMNRDDPCPPDRQIISWSNLNKAKGRIKLFGSGRDLRKKKKKWKCFCSLCFWFLSHPWFTLVCFCAVNLGCCCPKLIKKLLKAFTTYMFSAKIQIHHLYHFLGKCWSCAALSGPQLLLWRLVTEIHLPHCCCCFQMSCHLIWTLKIFFLFFFYRPFYCHAFLDLNYDARCCLVVDFHILVNGELRQC